MSEAKIQKLFDSIVELSIMEVVELVKKMEDELGVSAQAAVAVAAQPARWLMDSDRRAGPDLGAPASGLEPLRRSVSAD